MQTTRKIKQENAASHETAQAPQKSARRSGSIAIVTAAAVVALLGCCAMAADYGISGITKNKLQRVTESAALAGATELKKTTVDSQDFANARYQAKLSAFYNKVTLADSDITFTGTNRIRVGVEQQQRFLFGSAIGIPTGRVSAAAMAGRDYVSAITGALPLGITAATYHNFKPTPINTSPGTIDLRLARNTQEKFGPLNSDTLLGNTSFDVVALDLRYSNSGNSGALFQDDLTNGTNSQTVISQQVDPLGSSINSQGNKLQIAIQDRITRAAGAPWYDTGRNYTYPNYPANDPRVVFILVGADGYPAENSNPKLNLAYFVPAYIDGPVMSSNGSNSQTYLPLRLLPSVGLSSMATGVSVSPTGSDTGLTVVRLLE